MCVTALTLPLASFWHVLCCCLWSPPPTLQAVMFVAHAAAAHINDLICNCSLVTALYETVLQQLEKMAARRALS